MDPSTVRIICGALVVVFGALLFLRRRNSSKAE